MKYQELPFAGGDGIGLYSQCWLPEESPQAVIIIVHGMTEHSGRYTNFVNSLVANQYGVWAYDLRGHGRSGGRRGHINAWLEYRADLDQLLQMVQERFTYDPIFLFGHSMGTLIVLDYLIHNPVEISGVIVTGIPIEPAGVAKPYLVALAHVLSRFWPTCSLPLSVDTNALSRDTAVIKAYETDPLVLRRMTARWGTEALTVVEQVKRNAGQLTLPLLLLHGGADTLNLAVGAQAFYDLVGSNDKEMHLYPNARHELHNDLEHENVMADVLRWLGRHL